MSTKHNYTNPAFCQNSEFYPVPSANKAVAAKTTTNPYGQKEPVEAIYNRSLQINFNGNATTRYDSRDGNGPLRMQRSMSTRSVATKRTTTTAAANKTEQNIPTIHQQLHRQQQQHYERQQQQQQQSTVPQRPLKQGNHTHVVEPFEMRSGSGRYALVPVEELSTDLNSRYAIVPGPASLGPTPTKSQDSRSYSSLATTRRYAKSQDDLDRYSSQLQLDPDEPHSFHEDPSAAGGPYASLPPVLETGKLQPKRRISLQNRQGSQQNLPAPTKIKHAFSSDFGSKTFLIVDKNSNQRYQMVPTAEDEELVDDNHEIIQMHNGKAHRYAVIPAEDEDDYEEGNDRDQEETCLSNPDLNHSQNFLPVGYEQTRTPMRTSTPQKGISMSNLASYPNTPLKNPQATKMLHELLSTPRKTPNQQMNRSNQNISRNVYASQRELRIQYAQQGQQINFSPAGGATVGNSVPPILPRKNSHLSPQRLHYETVKSPSHHPSDRTMAVIQPRVAGTTYPHIEEEEDCSSIHGKTGHNNSSYPQKVVSATITLAIVSLMLVLGSSMNSALIVYMIAHLGRAFYLQFSLVAAISGVGLGFLGFRSRHCEWLPNRSYTSGYILVTVFCLLKCCCLLVILVLDPYPGLPLHDVTTGIILGLSTFTMFFIGLGVIGTLWCYRPPPDNRVNVV
ncbi:sanpodo [Haematobia irritans]|uniref:sanpodo n=1 Tax=Haematobia irritans TaxID=7368 RepID=UPI003F4FFA5A